MLRILDRYISSEFVRLFVLFSLAAIIATFFTVSAMSDPYFSVPGAAGASA